jgi:hypothetical protein
MRGREQGDPTEELTITVIPAGAGLTVEPSTITGILDKDTVIVIIRAANFNVPPDPDGKVTIKIIVDDGEVSDTLIYRLRISEETDFVCPILIENNMGANQILSFGTAPRDATTGDGLDAEPVGTLDSNFCEFELPPLPPLDVFDVRWTISTKHGIIRNIFPRAQVDKLEERYYRAKIQAGGENGNTAPAYPVVLSWNKDDIPDKSDVTINPAGSQWFIRDAISDGSIFNINMKTGLGQAVSYIVVENGPEVKIRIQDNIIDAFVILYDWASPVNEPIAGLPQECKIISVSPNPFIIDALGNIVATVADAAYGAGYFTINWNGRGFSGNELSSGAYTCRLMAGGVTSAYPIMIIK